MAGTGRIRKAVQRIMVTVFSLLEILGLPRIPRDRTREEGEES